ncbi:MAG: glucokinase, partial [Alphaproteobacteria bacterium]
LPEAAIRPLVAGRPAPAHAARLVIGLGTGFNCAPVHETGAGRFVPPAEAGHVNLPIRSEIDFELGRALEEAHGFPSVEEVLSGRGLVHTFGWFARRAGTPRDLTSAEILSAAEAGDDVARAALGFFVRVFGAVTGNLALIHLPFGGIFLAGGLARAVSPFLGPMGYGEALRDKGRFAEFMGNFAVSLIEDDYAALTGCAHHLAEQMQAAR